MKTRPALNEWKICAETFPADGSAEEKLGFVLNYALLAPSTHNTQPWLFSIRGDIGGALQADFFDPIDPIHSAEMTASVLGIVFMGFAMAIAVGSPLLDFLGMGRLLGVSSVCFIAESFAIKDCP